MGNSGAGKSVLAAQLAQRLQVPHIELDAIFHLPDWRELPVDRFRAAVLQGTSADGWVVDGNYAAVRDSVWAKADTIVWLDPPRRVVMRRIIRRTFTRILLRRRLWNGNRESVKKLFSRDPERSIILWSWTKHADYRARYTAATADPRWSHVRFVRVRSASEAQALLASIA
ncbi:MAG: adenylate kinase [Candidatus Dormibacteraeota bacterium]|uniref:Adenylate kinase n=1 Tax=Candidatus Aeolococcus gillhamiae TaxID=3127015 RepID=A0A934N2L1_9BACT|nr:adenylate kinase [Candidatus Dormibacteraeota bacterium]